MAMLRRRLPYGAGYQQQSDWERGVKAAQGITGQATNLADAIVQLQQNARQNAVANQLLNTATPPRAALVDPGVDPSSGQANVVPAGVSTAGTAPATGGVAQLSLQQKMQQQDLADQLKRAQIENYLAQARGTGRYAPKPTGQLTPYQQTQQISNQVKAEEATRQKVLAQAQKTQAASTDTFEKLDKDFNTVYGKGSGEKYFNALSSGAGTRGNIVGGQFVPDANGQYYTPDTVASHQEGGFLGMGTTTAWPKLDDLENRPVKMDSLQPFLDRFKQIQQGGGKAVPPMVARAEPVTQADILVQKLNLPSAAAQSDQGAATADQSASNLPSPSSQDEYDQLPSGSQFVDGDGAVKTKP
jgi:hypothetical protein